MSVLPPPWNPADPGLPHQGPPEPAHRFEPPDQPEPEPQPDPALRPTPEPATTPPTALSSLGQDLANAFGGTVAGFIVGVAAIVLLLTGHVLSGACFTFTLCGVLAWVCGGACAKPENIPKVKRTAVIVMVSTLLIGLVGLAF
jgi:hypothetical protein